MNNKLYFWDDNLHLEYEAGILPFEIAAADFYNGNYYFIDSYPATDDLYAVSFFDNGAISTISPKIDISGNIHRWTFDGDIAVKDGIVYGYGRCAVSGHGFEFFTYDLGTGSFWYTKPTLNGSNYEQSLQLAFGSDGVLYGHRSGIAGEFYAVNTSDGSLTLVTVTPNPANQYTDLASGEICIPETQTETAWGEGPRFTPRGNWAMYFEYIVQCCNGNGNGDCQYETAWGGNSAGEGSAWWYYYDASIGGVQTIWAGQTIDIGTVEVVDGTVYITLTDGWELQPGTETVKIQGYETIPDSRPAAGLFTTYKGTELTVYVGYYSYYAIHLDVQNCLPQY